MESGPHTAPGPLLVDFLDDSHTVEAGTMLTFGRDADVVVDGTNLHLHRVLGAFAAYGPVWMLQNVGRHIPMVVRDLQGQSRSEVSPGSQVPIVFEESAVSFSAGRANYEIFCALSTPPPPGQGVDATDTVEFARVDLNDEQVLMILVLGESLLSGSGRWPADMPSNAEAAARLGWTVTKLTRKLDYLCMRLSDAGVSGLLAQPGQRAQGRRQLLVEHVVERRSIGPDDLTRLAQL